MGGEIRCDSDYRALHRATSRGTPRSPRVKLNGLQNTVHERPPSKVGSANHDRYLWTRAGARAAVSVAVLLSGVLSFAMLRDTAEGSRQLDEFSGTSPGITGIAASSSMYEVSDGDRSGAEESLPSMRRNLLFPRNGGGQALRGKPMGNPPIKKDGEPAMLHNYDKEVQTSIDLDDVQEGHIWIPVAIDKFVPDTEDPLVKMCQVNYAKYSDAPWMLPMGGLLSINSGCADISNETVMIVRMSTLEQALREGAVPVSRPTGFIFHETRCGSTLVANMLANIKTNVMWSESTGPWKVMHSCPKCPKTQIVRFLKVVMDAMSRSAHHEHFYFKFQSSEDIDAVTTAFPDVPWIFIFREPVEVMMSRLGAQRIGMEGMEKEVAAKVEKSVTTPNAGRGKIRGKAIVKETNVAQQLSGLCKKAIKAYEQHPDMGMMVEYPHLPESMVTTVLPDHFGVHLNDLQKDEMMSVTNKYSKVATFNKGSAESKFIEDAETKHEAASVAVTEAAQKFLYADYYKLQSLQTWLMSERS